VKLCTFSNEGLPRVGLIVGSGIVDLSRHNPYFPSQMMELIAEWPLHHRTVEELSRGAVDFDLGMVKLHAPVRRPGKVFAIGLNYSDHCHEAGLEPPKNQVWFCKAVTSINGPHDSIELPWVSQQLDYECELVAVIGKRCRNVTPEKANQVIFGYCIGNDVSVRDWQLNTSQWSLGKSFDTHAPIGPWITTVDEVDPHHLDICCLVNGDVRQRSNTKHLIFNTYQQVAHLSQAMSLEPGDLIFTGTCGGVGAARKPPVWLVAGDIVRIEIESLGAIENQVVAGSSQIWISSNGT
jgi:2-keto-4-pentenoate hydratase/2-oxohepta-3-ene-1,7-dioic acid hydratase in catechol pathway